MSPNYKAYAWIELIAQFVNAKISYMRPLKSGVLSEYSLITVLSATSDHNQYETRCHNKIVGLGMAGIQT